MATIALAQATLFALRQQIAKIEGHPAETLDAPAHAAGQTNELPVRDLLVTGVDGFDRTLGGGLPLSALTEIHGPQTRDTAAVSGFALTLAALLRARDPSGSRLLWIGTGEAFGEAGFPYAPGLLPFCGIPSGEFLFARAARLADALWIAEEAIPVKDIGAVFLELRGNPRQLDLTATRRLHRRAERSGKPVFLLRQAAGPEPTAAPVRLVVSAAPAAECATIAGPLPGSIGLPAFKIAIDKSRTSLPGQFILEWNPHDLTHRERRPQNPGSVVSASRHGTHPAPASGAVLAFRAGAEESAAGRQPSRKQHSAHRRARRAG